MSTVGLPGAGRMVDLRTRHEIERLPSISEIWGLEVKRGYGPEDEVSLHLDSIQYRRNVKIAKLRSAHHRSLNNQGK